MRRAAFFVVIVVSPLLLCIASLAVSSVFVSVRALRSFRVCVFVWRRVFQSNAFGRLLCCPMILASALLASFRLHPVCFVRSFSFNHTC